MGSIAKWVMIISGIVVTLVVVVVVVALVVLKPENYEGVVRDQVRQMTGRDFHGAAGTEIHFFPLGLEGNDFVFGNAEGFGPEPMVSIDSIEFRIRFMPLLSGQIVVSQVHMDGVDVLLQRNKQGVSNWDDLAGNGNKNKQPEPAGQAPSSPSEKPVSFAVEDLIIDGLHVVYDDQFTGARHEVIQGDIDFTDFELGKPFDFNIKAKLTSNKPVLVSTLNMSGKAKLELALKQYSVTGLKAHVDAAGEPVPGESLGTDIVADDIVLDLKAESLKADGLDVKAHDVSLSGDLAVAKLLSKPEIRVKLAAEPFNLRDLLTKLKVELPEMADEDALSRVGGSFAAAYTGDMLKLSDVALNVDGSSFDGNAVISNFDKPGYEAKFKIDALNVDHYLPSDKEGGNATEMTTGDQKGPVEESKDIIPVELVRSLDIDAELAVGKLTVKKLNLSDVRVKLVAENGRVAVDPLYFNGYDGSVDSVLMLDASTDNPRTDLVTEAESLQLGPLLKDLTGKDSFKGKANLYAALGAYGVDPGSMKKSLSGKLNFGLHDGIFPGVDVAEMAKETKGAKKDSPKIEAEAGDKTRFGSITGSAKVKDGVVSTGDLEVRAPNIRAIGEGDVDLVKERLSFLVKAKLVPSGKGQGGSSYDDTIGVPVPIRISGSIAKPSYFVNPAEYILMLGTGVVDTVGGVVKGVGGVFKGLIPGQKKEKPAEQ